MRLVHVYSITQESAESQLFAPLLHVVAPNTGQHHRGKSTVPRMADPSAAAAASRLGAQQKQDPVLISFVNGHGEAESECLLA